ncbi:MAG: hypothetical protein H6567_12225 [Lewinellaceae bacterium]|nr:hypothetical protein [Lewinellaceae bacterium]
MLLLSLFTAACDQQEENSNKNAQEVSELRSSGLEESPCTDISGKCDPDNVQTLSYTLTDVDGYPGCNFFVSVTMSECNIGPWFTTYIGEFHLDSYNCPKYTQDLKNAMITSDSVLVGFLSDFDQKLYIAFEDYYYGLNSISCERGQQREFQYYLSSCKQYCIKYVENQKIQTISAACGNGCCRRQTSMCTDPVTGKVNKQTIYTSTTTADCGTIIPDFGRHKCDYVTSCVMTCQ